MLRLEVRHRTAYTYSEPVAFGQHRLVLRPREGHDLRIVDMRVQIEPAHEITWIRDVYGNSIALVDFTAPAERLEIVERRDRGARGAVSREALPRAVARGLARRVRGRRAAA